jgi:hypothetical protein
MTITLVPRGLATGIVFRRPGIKYRIGGVFLFSFIHQASAPVILSAAGAKDLLMRRTPRSFARALRALAQDDNSRGAC